MKLVCEPLMTLGIFGAAIDQARIARNAGTRWVASVTCSALLQ